MARWKQPDGDIDPNLGINDTLAVLLRATPKAYEEHFEELRKTPGFGRKYHRQVIEHWLGLMAFISRARRDGKLDQEMITRHDEILRKFRPLIDPLLKLHGRIPKIVEEDTNKFGVSETD
jgi:hypothetical protein